MSLIALVAAVAPGLDLLADAGHAGRGGDARLQQARAGRRSVLRLRGHRYVTLTFTVLVVSLPRMSITLTTIAYSPGSS